VIELLAQTELLSGKLFERGIATVVVAVFLWLIIWYSQRLAGKDGTLPTIAETLVQLKDLSSNQQTLCSQHTAAMVSVASTLDIVSDRSQITPELDAMLAACDTWSRISRKYNADEEVTADIDALKDAIVRIRDRVRGRTHDGET